MTITYQFNVATSGFFGFTKLLGKWRGSVYKLIYKEMLLYVTAYGLISFSYRLLMTEPQKRIFEKVSLHCARYLDLIPLAFVLGFYVTFIVQRWWTQFTTIPWPDRLMNTVILYVDGTDEKARLIRRTLMRYWNLSFVLILSSISIAVKKRFPTLDQVVEAGFMTEDERIIFNDIHAKINKYFIPMCWFLRLLDKTKKDGRIPDGAAMKHILEELNDTRTKMSLLWCHDWVTMPLVYTQVVTWATHLFFVASLVGRQFLDPDQGYRENDIDLYVPIFTLLQFFFYMGWLKVAEQLINPFGEDDDDFETNWLIDRHIQVSYLGVDELYTKTPPIVKDLYWGNKEPDVPYTSAALIHRIPTYKGSTMHLKIPEREQHLLHMSDIPQDYQNHYPIREKRRGIYGRIKDALLCGKDDSDDSRAFDFQTMWADPTINDEEQELNETSETIKSGNGGSAAGSGGTGKSTVNYHRTLGRKESLMAEDFLAWLNAGRRRSRNDRPEMQHLHTNGTSHFHANNHPTSDNSQHHNHHSNHHGGGITPSETPEPGALPMTERERRIGRYCLGRQESTESNLSTQLRAGSSLSVKGDSHNSRFSFASDGEYDEDTLPPMHLHVHHDVKVPLARLSEVENETDGDMTSNNSSPLENSVCSSKDTIVQLDSKLNLVNYIDEDIVK